MMAFTYLVLSILCSSFINLVFRWFGKFRVDTFHAIVINYLVCFLIGSAIASFWDYTSALDQDWFIYSLLLGILFIGIFFSMGQTTIRLGISVNAVSSKMAVAVPLVYAFVFACEKITWLFVIGIICSLISVIFISVKKNLNVPPKLYWLPVIVFLGSGVIDTFLKILQTHFANEISLAVMSATIFLGAFISGLLVMLCRSGSRRAKSIEVQSIVGGLALGIPNFFSIFFLLHAINAFNLKSAFVFGINNVGIVLLSTLLSFLIFKEHLSSRNKFGLILAIISILVISYAS